MANNRRKRKASFGVLFWIAVILLFLVVFVATKPRIQQVVQNTGLMTVLKDRFGNGSSGNSSNIETRNIVIGTDKNTQTTSPTPATQGQGLSPDKQTTPPGAGTSTPPNTPPKFRTVPGLGAPTENTGTTTQPDTAVPNRQQPAGTASSSSVPPNAAPSGTTKTSAGSASTAAAKPAYHVRESKLFYTLVTDDGKILPKAVTRPVKYVDSPLTDTIRMLLQGPTPEELNKGLLNLIPQHTKLLSAYVQNGIAYLSFNEAFEFNPMGVEGFIAQLEQIIHTAIEFPTVSRVQFLVKGKKLEYLGGEGIFIGKPLGPDSFS